MLPSVLSSQQKKKNISADKNIRRDSRHKGKKWFALSYFWMCGCSEYHPAPCRIIWFIPICLFLFLLGYIWACNLILLSFWGEKSLTPKLLSFRNTGNLICRRSFFIFTKLTENTSIRVNRVFLFYLEIASKRFHYYGEYKITS